MEKNSSLIQLVLDALEPDAARQAQWLKPQPLAPVLDTPQTRRFARMIQEADKIFIFGDYDADGILGTSILTCALRGLKKEVGYYIPNRLLEGYGLNEQRVRQAHEKGYDLLITVDNGVRAHPAIALAHELGLKVIVTDHHTLEEEVKADLLIHPTLMDTPRKNICGAGVAYELARVLNQENPDLLTMAAVASIADQMEVTGQSRAYIQQGLLQRQSYEFHWSQLGLRAFENESKAAFQVVPKLNAAGRMADLANANHVVRLFTDPSLQRQAAIAQALQQVNQERKSRCAVMKTTCARQVNPLDPLHLIVDDSLHEGIMGIAAGQIMEDTGHPVIVMTRTPMGYKASMRGPRGFHCLEYLKGFDGFAACGGHAQAAGFSLDLVDLEAFRAYVRSHPPQYEPQKKAAPIVITRDQISLEAIQSLDALRPFGPGFEEPYFEIRHPDVARIYDSQDGRHRIYMLKGGLRCPRFNQTPAEQNHSLLDVASFIGRLSIDEYRGQQTPRFIIEEIKYK